MAGKRTKGSYLPGRGQAMNIIGKRWVLFLCSILFGFPGSVTVAQDSPRELSKTFSVKIVTDIAYTEGGDYPEKTNRLDLYLPEGAKNFPVMIYLHGGALMAGDKSSNTHIGIRFVSEGFGVVAVNYRLSPGVLHPAHIQDVASAFGWVYNNISKYGGDSDNIFVVGHSAGGYLVALLAFDSKYLEDHRLSPASIKGVISISGYYHVERVAPDRPKSIWGTERNGWLEASPSRYVNKNAPPFLSLYADGEKEWRRRQSEEIVQELAITGHTHSQAHMIADRDHGTIWQRLNSDGDDTSRLMVEFMRGLIEEK